MNLAHPLVPKNPNGVLQVIILGRISTPQQDLTSIASQQEEAERWLRHVCPGAIQVHRLGEQASGLLAARPSLVEAQELISTGEWDLVVVSELREIHRNPRYQWAFVQDCLDNDTRVICIGDHLDTADENWEIMMHAAALRHGMTIPEARRRVRRKATYAFAHGGMVLKVKYGYRKLTKEEADRGQFGTPGLRVAKRPECTPVIHAMRDRLLRGASATAVADWLTDEGIAPGPYVTSGQWTRKLVTALFRDPILSGTRSFRKVLHQPIYGTGRHRRRPNEQGPELQQAPELAHITPAEQAAVIAVLDAQAKGPGASAGKESALWNKPRSRTPWPGQHAVCGACGGRMYRYGRFLRCQHSVSASTRTCWNHVQVEYTVLRAKVLPCLVGILDQHPDSRGVVVEAAWNEFERSRRRRQRSGHGREQRRTDLDAQAQALAKAIAKGGELEALVAELARVEAARQEARVEGEQFAEQEQTAGDFQSAADVAARLEEALGRLVLHSLDFADLLRRLIPVFVIQPVQALDCPQVRPRAQLTLRLDPGTPGGEAPLERSVVLDLFEPPVHLQHLAACVAMKAARPKAGLAKIAAALSINRMTVKRALGYARLMEQAGLTDPYRVLHGRPEQASRWYKRRPREDGSAAEGAP